MASTEANVPEIQVQRVQSISSTDSEGQENAELAQNKRKLKVTPRLQERRDSGSSYGEEEEEVEEITEELREKIISQAELYFSNENLKRDGFLLKHVKRNKEGFVNMKLLASFKKMKSLSRNYKVIGEALKSSKKLIVNETGLRVRRVEPLPTDLLDQVRVKYVVVSKIPDKNPSMNYITDAFEGYKDEVASVRIIKPGKKFPNDLQSHFSRHPDLHNEICAVVEFESAEVATQAVNVSFTGKYEGINVQLLELGPRQGKKTEGAGTASDTPIDSDASTGSKTKRHKKKKTASRLLEVSTNDDSGNSYASSSDGEFSSFSSCSKRYNRSRGNSPAGSPKLSRRFDGNNNSKNASPISSPGGSPRVNRKTKSSPDHPVQVLNGHKLSPLVSTGSPRSSPETKRKNVKKNSEDLPTQSAWLLKRMQLSDAKEKANMESLKAGSKQLDIVRQPKGPDGSSGFNNHPLKKYILVHAC